MHSLNFIIIGTTILLGICLCKLLPKNNKWCGLLLPSLLLLIYFAGEKSIVLIAMWLFTYLFGRAIAHNSIPSWTYVLVILSALVISKLSEQGNHFTKHTTSILTANIQFDWANLFQIIGISYFTFLALSYLFDIKRGYIKPETNPFKLLLFLIYFPTIFSGPLHRYKYLSKQFKEIKVTNDSISAGLRLILWGLFKNLVVATYLFKVLNNLLKNEISGPYYLICGLLFFLYLFVNFSSFIDLFQGVSQLFSIKLKDNFRSRAYLSPSRQYFWRGWHITLNEWFRDYFFFPFAKLNRTRNFIDLILLFTFLLIALWHEVSLIVFFWGVLNGTWIILEKRAKHEHWPLPSARHYLGICYHFFFASILAMVFISPSLSELVKQISSKPHLPLDQITPRSFIIMVVSFSLMDYFAKKTTAIRISDYLKSQTLVYRWSFYLILTAIILVFGNSGQIDNYYNQF